MSIGQCICKMKGIIIIIVSEVCWKNLENPFKVVSKVSVASSTGFRNVSCHYCQHLKLNASTYCASQGKVQIWHILKCSRKEEKVSMENGKLLH